MKIVHICLTGPVTDGFSYQDNLLSKYHKKLGYDVDFITSQWVWGSDGKLQKNIQSGYVNQDGVRMYRLSLIGSDRFDKKIKIYKNLYKIIEDCGPDIIFVHSPQFLQMNTIRRYIDKNKQVRLFVDNHADFSNSATNFFSKYVLHMFLWRICANLVVNQAEKFYGVLPARVDFLREMYKIPSEKCELLVMGADDEQLERIAHNSVRDNMRRRMDVSVDDFVIVTGGKIDNWKRQTLLLMAAVQKLKKYKVKLFIFGSIDKDIKNEFNALCDDINIKYLGWADAEQSYNYFSMADLVVFPGRHSVYWEQVAGMGIPMVCKYWKGATHVDCGGNVEFLMNDSVDEIENTIKKLVSDSKLYASMKHIAAGDTKKRFSYKEIAKYAIEY